MAEYLNMASDANYPSDAGYQMTFLSGNDANFIAPSLLHATVCIAGDPDETDAAYIGQVKTGRGNWVPVAGMTRDDVGVMSGFCEGQAFRLNADNGTSPGTTTSTPRTQIEVHKLQTPNDGEYSG